jgi:hypothetical protein
MKKLFLLLIAFLFLITLFSGCTDQQHYCKVEGSGMSITITDAEEPLHVDIIGNENTIRIDKDVVLTEISCAWGFNNNTFLIYGESIVNGTSSWQNHNCTVNMDENNNIQYYQED